MSFLNPLFLIGALAAAVPVLLHLVRREHARRIEFPTLMFLHRISRKTIRYQKLRHLLLLLMRVLALLLIVLAFMRPYREKAQAASIAGRMTGTHIIVVDNSMSMDYRGRWERAKSAAAEIVRNAGPDERFAVLEFSDTTREHGRLSSAGEASARIEKELDLTDRPTRYAQALRAAERIAINSGTAKRTIYLISDFQLNGWTSAEQDFTLGSGIDLRIVDVGSGDFSNIAVRDVRVTEADRDAGNATTLNASVTNFGNLERRDVSITLTLDGRQIASRKVDIPAGGSQGITFELPVLASGNHAAVVSVDDPNLTRDNRFYLNLEAHGKTVVQVVESPATASRSSSFFLARALDVDVWSPYKIKSVTPESLTSQGNLIIWNNARSVSSVHRKLQEFVREGGGLAVVIADSSGAADFNSGFSSWLPVTISERAARLTNSRSRPAEDYVLMTDLKGDHPIFRPFSQPHSGSFSTARFFNYVRLSAGSDAEVLARFDNGDPALISLNYGKGRVLIFASSADDSSNDLPLKAVYAPFWQQMLRHLENYRERRLWMEVGETIDPEKLLFEEASRQGNREHNESLAVLDPEKERLSTAEGRHVTVEKTGFYEIRTMNTSISVGVNPASGESDLTRGDPAEMAAGWRSSKPSSQTQDDRPVPEQQEKGQRSWSYLLSAGLLLLIAEMMLSGRQPAQSQPEGE